MTYRRVLPRDLFNEAKLLKCYGQLSLLIHDGKVAGLPLELEHSAGVFPEFVIEQDGLRGHLLCSNLSLRLAVSGNRTTGITLGLPVNIRGAYPLVCVTPAETEIEVFNDDGSLSEEFLAHVHQLRYLEHLGVGRNPEQA